jgi:hypothetical protein
MKSCVLSIAALLPLVLADTSKYNADYSSQESKIKMVRFISILKLNNLLIPTNV